MHTGVDDVGELLTVLGPVFDLAERFLDLGAGHGDGTADLGHQDPAQPLLLGLQRVVQLHQTVVAELDVAAPVGLVEGSARGADGTLHVGHTAVGGLARNLLCRRIDHIECRAAAGVLELAVDEHAFVAGQHTGGVVHLGHAEQLYKNCGECHPLERNSLSSRSDGKGR